ncbi:recombination protein RecR [Candidatus Uhrbacteria bacterium]|nr:recombination protein RecR [Candidatus Uhrbacteria bacterium]
MNTHLPDPIRALAQLFKELPGVGPKTALRFVFALLREPREKSERLARALLSLHAHIKTCATCGVFTSHNPCATCKDPKRDPRILCVVAESRDIATIESTGEYSGRYFVLGGLLSPLEGSTPDTLRVTELADRLSAHPEIKEVVLAFSPDLRGESTILFLVKRLQGYPVKLTRLARGLPLGADLEYADEVTLADALKGRREIA